MQNKPEYLDPSSPYQLSHRLCIDPSNPMYVITCLAPQLMHYHFKPNLPIMCTNIVITTVPQLIQHQQIWNLLQCLCAFKFLFVDQILEHRCTSSSWTTSQYTVALSQHVLTEYWPIWVLRQIYWTAEYEFVFLLAKVVQIDVILWFS